MRAKWSRKSVSAFTGIALTIVICAVVGVPTLVGYSVSRDQTARVAPPVVEEDAPDEPPIKVPQIAFNRSVTIAPFRVNGTHFEVVRNASVVPPVYYASAAVTEGGAFKLPEGVTKVFIEVGTNDEPELGPLLKVHPTAVLVGFEPQPGVFSDMIKRFPMNDRLIAFPSAVTPQVGFVPMYVSAHKGCSSLLSMNDRARAFAKKEGKRAPRKSGVIQLRTLEYCVSKDQQIQVPAFPLLTVLDRIPSTVSIDLLMVDAQGFDSVVISTVGSSGKRVKFIVLECQDLTPGHLLFLVKGAPTCDQQRKCFEASMPHKLEYCWDNAPKVREYNCLYRHPDVSLDELPKGLKIVSQPRTIFYPTEVAYECPKFL